ncbi:alpha/beta hydrolase fold domain-containing protein [Vibrio zhugei]|uniref:Alpha/beta hydrolase fold domain-containing protein n=1 Tax=Vibrio zhugei TaxID=2479546 RepID=A0ABV7C7Q9_9VIBR|nr:alpha/beta hydrolase [Vibrio zhugei]
MSNKKPNFQTLPSHNQSLDEAPDFKTQSLPGYTNGAKVIQAAKIASPPVDSISDVIYSQIPHESENIQLRMSLLVPRTSHKKPAIVFYPGGGFTSAQRNKFIEMRMKLAQAGFVVAAAEYRVLPHTFPAPLVDGKSAVRFLRANAESYNIDVSRIGVLGNSAGGWLAEMMGTTNEEVEFDKGWFLEQPSNVNAVATLYGISNLLNIGEGYEGDANASHKQANVPEALLINGIAFHDHLGGTINSDEPKALFASPLGHMRAGLPPFLIMHGSNDSLVSPVQGAQLFEALQAHGHTPEYYLIEGADHGDESWYQEATIKIIVDWFCQQLLPTANAS